MLSLPSRPGWTLGADVSDEGRWAFVSLSPGTGPENELWAIDLAAVPLDKDGVLDFTALRTAHAAAGRAKAGPAPASTHAAPFSADGAGLPLRKLAATADASYEYVASRDDGSIVLRTNAQAPRYRLVVGSVEAGPPVPPPSTWPDLVPQHPANTMQWAAATQGDTLLVEYLEDVKAALQVRM